MTVEPSEWHSFGDPPERDARAEPRPVAHAASRQSSAVASHRNTWLAVGFTIIVAVVGVAVFVTTVAMAGGGQADVVVAAQDTPSVSAPAEALAPDLSDPGSATHVLLVDVEGAVRAPGLHQVPVGSRIGDAITIAGGYADRADLDAAALTLNLAEPLEDGAKIRVPLLGEIGSPAAGIGPTPASEATLGGGQAGSGLVDLNHADEAALESLPGIGPVTAGKIVAARAGDPFTSLDDVVGRKVLTASVLDKIRALVTVSP